MTQILQENPIILLFVVTALGYLIGNIKLGNSSLGVAAVLFVGLVFGAIDPAFKLPNEIFQIGLILFIYAIGLSSAPAFFESIRRNGVRDLLFIIAMLTFSFALALLLSFLLGFDASIITGIYSGSTTNTPALAGAINLAMERGLSNADQISNDMVVGYSYSYPMGIIGVMLAIGIVRRIFNVDFNKEMNSLKNDYPLGENLTSKTLNIENTDLNGVTLRDLLKGKKWKVKFVQVNDRKQGMTLTHWSYQLKAGDQIMVVGELNEIEKVKDVLGSYSEVNLSKDRRLFDVRRIFVSNPKVIGKRVSELELDKRFNAIITRIRRGDTDMLANGNTVLQSGDRIRFIASRKELKALSRFFGDSYTASSQVNLFSFGIGITLGLLLGMITIQLPGGLSFKLGLAGGPLVVALILGMLRRTGPIIWTLPYGANVTIQQIGLSFLLAAIGVSSGSTFVQNLSIEALEIMGGAAIIAIFTTIFALVVGYKLVKIPFSILLGFVSNQPAILDFNLNITKNKVPNIGYTLMMPLALILKIIYAQLLFIFLQ